MSTNRSNEALVAHSEAAAVVQQARPHGTGSRTPGERRRSLGSHPMLFSTGRDAEHPASKRLTLGSALADRGPEARSPQQRAGIRRKAPASRTCCSARCRASLPHDSHSQAVYAVRQDQLDWPTQHVAGPRIRPAHRVPFKRPTPLWACVQPQAVTQEFFSKSGGRS